MLSDVVSQLRGLLCDPEGKCCIQGSDGDRAAIDECLAKLSNMVGPPKREAKEMYGVGFTLQQAINYFKDQKRKHKTVTLRTLEVGQAFAFLFEDTVTIYIKTADCYRGIRNKLVFECINMKTGITHDLIGIHKVVPLAPLFRLT